MSFQIFDIPTGRLFLMGQNFEVKRNFLIKSAPNRVAHEDVWRGINISNSTDIFESQTNIKLIKIK